MSYQRLISQDSRHFSPLLRYSSSGYDEDTPRPQEDQPDLGRPRYSTQVIAALSACLGAITCGMTLAYSSPALHYLQEEYGWNDFQSSWFGSVVTLGAMVGGLIAGLTINRFGRKVTIMSVAVPSTLGWLIIICTGEYVMLLAGRALTGVAVGMASLSVPIYVAEIASKDVRGFLGTLFLCCATLGVLLVNGFGIPLSWRWLAVATSVIPTLLAVAMTFMPETPRWLLSKGQYSRARDSLCWLRGHNYDFDLELHMIHQHVITTEEDFSLRQIFTKKYSRLLIISVGLMAAQQLSGIGAILFYTEEIFETAGFSGSSSLPMMTVAGTQFVAAIVSCFLMDIAGRRILLMISGVILTISCFTFGLYYYLTNVLNISGLGWLSLGSAIVFMIGFPLGLGPVPWLMMGELFPVKAQGLACSISIVTNYLCSFLVAKEFVDLETALHKYGAFWLFAAINFLSIIFVAFLVPETKGKSLEEIENEFDETRDLEISSPNDYGTPRPSVL